MVRLNGIPLIDRVVSVVSTSGLEAFQIATSPNTPQTYEYCLKMKYPTIQTLGKGYHEDLKELLKIHPNFLSIAVDLPFLTKEAIRTMIESYKCSSLTGTVPQDVLLKGLTPSYVFEKNGKSLVAIGLNVVSKSQDCEVVVFDDPLLGVNLNTLEEVRIAENLCMLGRPSPDDKKLTAGIR